MWNFVTVEAVDKLLVKVICTKEHIARTITKQLNIILGESNYQYNKSWFDSIRYAAHIRGERGHFIEAEELKAIDVKKAGLPTKIVIIEGDDITNIKDIEGWRQECFLYYHCRSLIEFYDEITHIDKQDSIKIDDKRIEIKGKKTILLDAIKEELWISLNALNIKKEYLKISEQKPSRVKDGKVFMEFSRQLLQSVRENLLRLSIGREISIPIGYQGHSFYLAFIKITDQSMLLRIDNVGDGCEYHLSQQGILDDDEKKIPPYVLAICSLINSTNDSDITTNDSDIIIYLSNLFEAKFIVEKDKQIAFNNIYDLDEDGSRKVLFPDKNAGYFKSAPWLDKQVEENCVFINYAIGMNYRLLNRGDISANLIFDLFCSKELQFSISVEPKPASEEVIDYFPEIQEKRREHERKLPSPPSVQQAIETNINDLLLKIAKQKHEQQQNITIPAMVSNNIEKHYADSVSYRDCDGQVLLNLIKQENLLLYGESGIGKSRLCYDLLLNIIDRNRIPVFIENKKNFYQNECNLLESDLGIWQYIGQYLCKFYPEEIKEANVTPKSLSSFLQNNAKNITCIIDGFCFSEDQYDLLKNAIIMELNVQSASTPQFIISSHDKVAAFGASRRFQVRRVLGFSESAIKLFLRNSELSLMAQESLIAIDKNIMKVPQSLKLVCDIIKGQYKGKKFLTDSRYHLYNIILDNKIRSVYRYKEKLEYEKDKKNLDSFIQKMNCSDNSAIIIDNEQDIIHADILKDAGVLVREDEENTYSFSQDNDAIRYYLSSYAEIKKINDKVNHSVSAYDEVYKKLTDYPPVVIIFVVQYFLEKNSNTLVEKNEKKFIFGLLEYLLELDHNMQDVIFQCFEKSDVLEIDKNLFPTTLNEKLNTYFTQNLIHYNDLQELHQCVSKMLDNSGMLNYLKNQKEILKSFLHILNKEIKSIRYIANGKAFIFIFNNLREIIRTNSSEYYYSLFTNAISTYHYAGYYDEAYKVFNQFKQDLLQKSTGFDLCRAYYVVSAAARAVYNFDEAINYLKKSFLEAKNQNSFSQYGVVLCNVGLQKLSFYYALKNSPKIDKEHLSTILLDAIADLYESLHWLDLKSDSVYLLRISTKILDVVILLTYYQVSIPASRLALYKKVAYSLIELSSESEKSPEWNEYKKTIDQFPNLTLDIHLVRIKEIIINAIGNDGLSEEELNQVESYLKDIDSIQQNNNSLVFDDIIKVYKEIFADLKAGNIKPSEAVNKYIALPMTGFTNFPSDKEKNFYEKVKKIYENFTNTFFQPIISDECCKKLVDGSLATLEKFAMATGQSSTIYDVLTIKKLLVAKTPEGNTLLHFAAAHGDIAMLKILFINCKMHFSMLNKNGFSPIHVAAVCRQQRAIEFIITHSVLSIFSVDNWGYSPVHVASYMEYPEIIGVLLFQCRAKPYINILQIKDGEGFSSLNYAKDIGFLNSYRAMLGIAHDHFDQKNIYLSWWDQVLKAKTNQLQYKIKQLDSKLFDVNSRGETLLHIAAAVGNKELVGQLLKFQETKHIDFDYVKLWPPYFRAAIKGHKAIIELFVQHNVAINEPHEMWTILHEAVICDDPVKRQETVRYLLDYDKGHGNIMLNAREENGMTALHIASLKRHNDTVELLKSYHVDENITDNYGMQRYSENNINIVQKLVLPEDPFFTGDLLSSILASLRTAIDKCLTDDVKGKSSLLANKSENYYVNALHFFLLEIDETCILIDYLSGRKNEDIKNESLLENENFFSSFDAAKEQSLNWLRQHMDMPSAPIELILSRLNSGKFFIFALDYNKNGVNEY
ncbi:MAG: ankyrin repeat domain-containing protein, partial [Gammaproteobacteria bacterium]